MASAQPNGALAECYARALMIEREAAARCGEFAEYLDDHGDSATAGLFRELAGRERRHADEIARRAAGLPLPSLRAWEFSWLDDAPPDQVSHEIVFHLMTPYDALKIALGAEQRAKTLFEHAASAARDPQAKALAEELAGEESEHIRLLEDALTAATRPLVAEADSEPLFRR